MAQARSAARRATDVELAEARAAVARAKADLAEAQVAELRAAADGEGVSDGAPVESGDVGAKRAVTVDMLESVLDQVQSGRRQASEEAVAVEPSPTLGEVVFGGNPVAPRPVQLLTSREAMNFFGLLARLDSVGMEVFGENQTAFSFVLQATIAALYRFVPVDPNGGGSLDDSEMRDLPQELRRDVEVIRRSLTPELLVATFIGLEAGAGEELTTTGGRDWRPLAQAFGRAQYLPELVEKAVEWDKVFPENLRHLTGITLDETKATAIAFVRRAMSVRPGDWTDDELAEAKRLIESDERFRRVVSRVEAVVSGMGDGVASAFAAFPVVLVVLILAALWCSFNGGQPGGQGDLGSISSSIPAYGNLQNLPLVGLEK